MPCKVDCFNDSIEVTLSAVMLSRKRGGASRLRGGLDSLRVSAKAAGQQTGTPSFQKYAHAMPNPPFHLK